MSGLDFFQIFDIVTTFVVYVVLDRVLPSTCADKSFEKSMQLTFYVLGGIPFVTYALQVTTGDLIAQNEGAWTAARLILEILNWIFGTAIGIAQLTASGDFKGCERLQLKGVIFVAHAAFKFISMAAVIIAEKNRRDDPYGMRGRLNR